MARLPLSACRQGGGAKIITLLAALHPALGIIHLESYMGVGAERFTATTLARPANEAISLERLMEAIAAAVAATTTHRERSAHQRRQREGVRGFDDCSTREVAARAHELLMGNIACQTGQPQQMFRRPPKNRFSRFSTSQNRYDGRSTFDATPPQSPSPFAAPSRDGRAQHARVRAGGARTRTAVCR